MTKSEKTLLELFEVVLKKWPTDAGTLIWEKIKHGPSSQRVDEILLEAEGGQHGDTLLTFVLCEIKDCCEGLTGEEVWAEARRCIGIGADDLSKCSKVWLFPRKKGKK